MIYFTLFLCILAAFLYFNNNMISVSNYKITLNKKPLSIIHLSDLHSKEFGKNNHKLYNMIFKQKCDVVVCTGDMINDDNANEDKIISFIGELAKKVTVVFIFGNHEYRLNKFDILRKKMESLNIIVLKNEHKIINIAGQEVLFLGLCEKQATNKKEYMERMSGKFVYENNSTLFSNLDNFDGIKIVLSHFPENFNSKNGYRYCKYNFDLQLSGHAHGGQFRIPFVGGIVAPGQGFFPKYTSGLFGKRPYLIISRGLGNSFFPFRLFNLPQIVKIDIN